MGKNESSNAIFTSIIYSLAKAIEVRDPYTYVHCLDVAKYSYAISIKMGLSEEDASNIYIAGLLHDIGKLGTPEKILKKQGPLTPQEFNVIKWHTEDGYNILNHIRELNVRGISEMVRFHHERPDGLGYPLGLKGEQIPLGSKILAVADAYDAMTTNRVYKQAQSVEYALAELNAFKGSQFDPKAVKAFLEVLEEITDWTDFPLPSLVS